MDNKPKMYRCNNKKVFSNNMRVYSSYDDNTNINVIYNTNDIRRKINAIINSDNFIYRTVVNIVLDNEIISKKIVGLYNNNLVTIDNEYIPINLIKDIYK